MVYDSTKFLIRSILQSLEKDDSAAWDDHIESCKECLYEMHQMARTLNGKTRQVSARGLLRDPVAEKLNRALPHVKAMVTAIRRRDQVKALESGKAALAVM